jgi:ABC-type antimicrobial peptide transport system permease subunit
VAVRSPLGASATLPAVQDAVGGVDADIPLHNVMTMEEVMAEERWQFRTFGTLFTIFALIALVLSSLGLYSVTAYSVAQRTREIGIRVALGGQPNSMSWLALRRPLGQVALGVPFGIAGVPGVGRILQSVLVQRESADAATFLVVVAVLLSVAVTACVAPARRATRLDPMRALRVD